MIKDLFNKLTHSFSDLSLKRKFMSCLVVLLALMTLCFTVSLVLVRRTDDRLLYNSTRGTVVYSAKVLSDKLLDVENMTRIMLSDSVIQENLAIADDASASYIAKSNAFSALGSAVPNYYYNFKDGTGMRYRIIKLTLQPLVENAIFHGIEPTGESGTISVTGRKDGDDIVISVADDGAGIPDDVLADLLTAERPRSHPSLNGIGVYNVHKRLQMLYGARYGLTIESEPGCGTCVTVRIPKEE